MLVYYFKMSDNEPHIIEQIDSHHSAGGADTISNLSLLCLGLIYTLTQSVERLVQTMTACQAMLISMKMFLLEDGQLFDSSLSISGENNSNENTTEKDAIVAFPDDDLFNSPVEYGDGISAGLATLIDLSCS